MADGATPPRPTGPSERIDAIDVLRGLALLGVVAINVVTIFRVSFFEQFLFPEPPLSFSSIDSAIETILTLAVELKALALFSLLFGAGIAIQFERLANSERRTALRSFAPSAPALRRTSRWSSVKSFNRTTDRAGRPAACRSVMATSRGQDALSALVIIAITL